MARDGLPKYELHRDRNVGFRLPGPTVDRVESLAMETGRSRSRVIELAINEYLDRYSCTPDESQSPQ